MINSSVLGCQIIMFKYINLFLHTVMSLDSQTDCHVIENGGRMPEWLIQATLDGCNFVTEPCFYIFFPPTITWTDLTNSNLLLPQSVLNVHLKG